MKTPKNKKPEEDPGSWREGFRWCEQKGRYVAVKVCENQARREKRCSKCYGEYLQLPLPFPGIKAP